MSSINIINSIINFIDYTPFSPITNATMLVARCIFSCTPKDNAIRQHLFTYINQRSTVERIVLLVPIFGNISIVIYDLIRNFSKSKIEDQYENKEESVNSIDSKKNELTNDHNQINLDPNQNDNQKIKSEDNLKTNTQSQIGLEEIKKDIILTEGEEVKVSIEITQEIDEEFTPDELRFLKHIPEEVVNLFGGKRGLINIPETTHPIDNLDVSTMTHKIMRSNTELGSLLSFVILHPSSSKEAVGEITVTQLLFSDGQLHPACTNDGNLLAFDSEETTLPYFTNRLERLIKGESLGILQLRVTLAVNVMKNDRTRPEDAYLSEDEYTNFFTACRHRYERKPEENSTDLILYDNSKTMDENYRTIKKKFPNSSIAKPLKDKHCSFMSGVYIDGISTTYTTDNNYTTALDYDSDKDLFFDPEDFLTDPENFK